MNSISLSLGDGDILARETGIESWQLEECNDYDEMEYYFYNVLETIETLQDQIVDEPENEWLLEVVDVLTGILDMIGEEMEVLE